MFVRRTTDKGSVPTTDAATPTLPRKSGAHQVAERELTKLRERRAAIADEIMERGRTRSPSQVGDGAVDRLEAERKKIDRAIADARDALAPLRAQYAALVEKALRPAMASAAQELLDTLDAADERRADVARLVKHIEIAAGEPRPIPSLDFVMLRRAARRFIA